MPLRPGGPTRKGLYGASPLAHIRSQASLKMGPRGVGLLFHKKDGDTSQVNRVCRDALGGGGEPKSISSSSLSSAGRLAFELEGEAMAATWQPQSGRGGRGSISSIPVFRGEKQNARGCGSSHDLEPRPWPTRRFVPLDIRWTGFGNGARAPPSRRRLDIKHKHAPNTSPE